jgi:hypothetical protein
VKHLRQTGLWHGVQVELSRLLQVSKSTVSADIRRLLGRPAELIPQAQQADVRHSTRAGRRGGHPEDRMHHMHKRICLRLSSALHRDLQQAARCRHMTPSAFVRTALQQALSQPSTAGAPSVPLPGDALERFVMTLPPDVQQAIRQTVTAVELPLDSVLKALIITAYQPKAPPQSSTSPETWRMAAPPA